MLDIFVFEKLTVLLRLIAAQCVTVFFFLLSSMSFSFAYMSEVRPEFFMMLVYYWAVFRPTLVSPVFVFLAGLVLDSLSGIPLGLNAFTLILMQWLVQRQRLFLMGQSFAGLWIGFMSAVACIVSIKWSVLSLLGFSILPFTPAAISILNSILFFPFAAIILVGVHKILPIHN